MPPVEQALQGVDQVTVDRVRPVLDWLRAHGTGPAAGRAGGQRPDLSLLRRFLWEELPAHWPGDGREHHEVAWALADVYQRAGLAGAAALCRSSSTHEILAVWRWTESFPAVPAEFWRPALAGLGARPGPPARVGLSLAAAKALLLAVGDGLPVTSDGRLPAATVSALDDRFRWTDQFPWLRRPGGRPRDGLEESDIPPLRFLREHLAAQRLLVREGDRLVLGDAGRRAAADTERLWWAVVDPAPRWTHEFERDTLGAMAASLLRGDAFNTGRIAEQITHVLAAKWQPSRDGTVFDGASLTVQAWYQLGVPLGWWDTGFGPADRWPNVIGRAAATALFRAVARRPDPSASGAGRG